MARSVLARLPPCCALLRLVAPGCAWMRLDAPGCALLRLVAPCCAGCADDWSEPRAPSGSGSHTASHSHRSNISTSLNLPARRPSRPAGPIAPPAPIAPAAVAQGTPASVRPGQTPLARLACEARTRGLCRPAPACSPTNYTAQWVSG